MGPVHHRSTHTTHTSTQTITQSTTTKTTCQMRVSAIYAAVAALVACVLALIQIDKGCLVVLDKLAKLFAAEFAFCAEPVEELLDKMDKLDTRDLVDFWDEVEPADRVIVSCVILGVLVLFFDQWFLNTLVLLVMGAFVLTGLVTKSLVKLLDELDEEEEVDEADDNEDTFVDVELFEYKFC
ncbi:hypothetical protein BpHYR1_049156 [Brachionus plicatilis]|uniref:Uncharacterized protein n=1 Tax=Brachionus plicatilis TaxID=10195 RepID=A0A3M7QR26_BRAPC|nr:hypothetical protein BpHYR1_049156 [Brachionus plicatilis]